MKTFISSELGGFDLKVKLSTELDKLSDQFELKSSPDILRNISYLPKYLIIKEYIPFLLFLGAPY